MFQGQHVYHGQEEAGLRNGAKTWSRWVLIGDGLQGNRLHAWLQEQVVDKLVCGYNRSNAVSFSEKNQSYNHTAHQAL